MNNDDDRIRKEAHRLWEAEGRPHDRAERHWAEAREIVALRDSMSSTLKPVGETLGDDVEPVLAAENLGDLPGLTDQGDETLAPSRKAAAEIDDEMALTTDKDAKREKGKAPKAKATPKAAAKAEPASAKGKAKPAKSDAKPAKSAGKAGKSEAKPAAKKKSARTSEAQSGA